MKNNLSIKTDTLLTPFTDSEQNITDKIGRFWDKISGSWQDVWGPHIHHGYYENDELISPISAQIRLIEKLTSLLKIRKGDKVLDAGCGLGGSSMYLAEKFGAHVSGITLSKVQVDMAEKKAIAKGIKNVSFKVEDALSLKSFRDNSFDLVWSLESCEQFADKSLFIKEAKRVMKKDGKFLLATWCSSKDEYIGDEASAYKQLCLAFDLPYMPSAEYYRKIFETQGLQLDVMLDWTQQVEKSWDIGISLVNAYSLFKILRKSGLRGLIFTKQLKYMQKGFKNKMVQYMVFVLTRPSGDR
ncbi:MAG: methyltransferase domain-containing protein [Oligoflexia bacterium]|nr:methyltransferase domain-containing protein [Oligoflexia bacterium]